MNEHVFLISAAVGALVELLKHAVPNKHLPDSALRALSVLLGLGLALLYGYTWWEGMAAGLGATASYWALKNLHSRV
jgi:hypothetical protein